MADRIGQRLGNYRLIRLLGQGGFADVYLGEHVRLGTYAAVKVLYTRLARNDQVERFQQEARTIAHLEHPHIVRVFDFDVQDDSPFLVMEHAAGGTLRQRHPNGRALDLPTIIAYVKQIADALQYAHDQHLIHRDIKPENMLLGRRDELLLSDFGIAILAQSSRYQSTQEMLGTMAYMAPEQIHGKPRPASDQYSFEGQGLTPSLGQTLQDASIPLLSRAEPAHQCISRRTVVLGLGVAGLAVAGGGLTWLLSLRTPLSSPSRSPSPTPTPTPTPTPIPTPTPTPVPTPTPTPIPTPTPTLPPAPPPALPPPPVPTPHPRPRPTPTPPSAPPPPAVAPPPPPAVTPPPVPTPTPVKR